ncbi:phage tail protein [Spirosoma oryzicola]|uniref:phage tail protein n=1 Tax=Spirosoma oryzicola TaxID=2898794 RepID=UPI001E512D10|nr:tail fiber protein [Spirosoma oryzicola]UHG93780.1 tail fiber protein [Spirosoma oryzicola]
MDPFMGEIRLMSFGFNPKYWAPCQGQLLPINQNQALFSLLGTMYGGNGVTNFALPDLRGRVVLSFGQGSGIQGYSQGERGGSEGIPLTTAQLAAHNHSVAGSIQTASEADGQDPSGAYPAPTNVTQYASGGANTTMAAITGQTSTAGTGLPHENRQPVMALNYCIAIQGIFPPHS